MRKYAKREFEATAEQFLSKPGEKLPEGVYPSEWNFSMPLIASDDPHTCYYLGTVMGWWEHGAKRCGDQTINIGDWIIKTNRGEIYCINDKDFFNAFNFKEAE